MSTTSSVRVRTEAEKAALEARAAALKQRHALEEQEQQLRWRREQLDMEIEIAAAAARLAVLRASEQMSESGRCVYDENLYHKGNEENVESMHALNSLAKECHPEMCKEHKHNTEQRPGPIIPQLLHPPPSDQPSFNEDLLTIMQKQNKITATLVQQQIAMSLPAREIPIFEGDPLQFRSFIKSFEHGVEKKAGQANCLYSLEQFTRGRPLELVKSCQHMAPEQGYVL